MISRLKRRAMTLRRETLALYIAARDPRVPWYAKAFMGLVLAYAFSPIDLIPDFVPVLGYLDDLVIVPLGIVLALRMVPAQVMADARRQADQMAKWGEPVIWAGGVIVVAIWLIILVMVFWLIVHAVGKK